MRTSAVAGRTRLDDPPARRGELVAGLATAAVVAQVVLAQATLVIAVTLIAIGRGSRWRPHWLLLPALAGLGWLLAGGAALIVALPHWPRLDLIGQLPLALLLGSAEAALVMWPVWWRHQPSWRAGLIAVLRRRASARALPAGHTVAADGFALGLVTDSGKLATVAWTEAERGVLLTGQDGAQLCELGLGAVCAALRLRKTVLVLDLAGVATIAVGMARALGVPVTVAGQLSSAELGRAIRRRSAVVGGRGTIELIGLLDSLSEHQLRADCLAWITGAEQLEPAYLDRLLELGPATGTALLFSSASEAWAAGLAPRVQIVAAAGPVTGSLAVQLVSQPHTATPAVAANLAAQRSGEFTMLTALGDAGIRPSVLPNCLLVPVDVQA